ncbi:hypothetical protein [Fictibacillus phosphorivorans]|uniref:hypothetical protein n=1 Tax=Fictibacillus phosphorivorans TaxID=1221500 RepID=UPI001E57E960|nr:hypothetical protein [Fictibacillus phosphorivorans]
MVGHQIRVGKYHFCAIPVRGYINVSEITTGSRVFNFPINVEMMLVTESKEGAISLFQKIGESLKNIINSDDNFDLKLKMMRKTAIERLGEMPPIEDYDSTWLFAEESDVLN